MGNAPGTEVALLEKRRIEAAILADLYAVLTKRLGRDIALAIIEETVARSSFEAGKAFAAAAPQGPNLAHFVTVANLWRRGGALTIENEQQTPDCVSFAVTRCRYVESYREMGLPEDWSPGYPASATVPLPPATAPTSYCRAQRPLPLAHPAALLPSPGITHEHTTHHCQSGP